MPKERPFPPVQVYLPMRSMSPPPPIPPPDNHTYMSKADQRRQVLAELDNAVFTKFHVRTVLTAGAGFFTDAYDLFAINLCANMIGQVYSTGGVLTPAQELSLKVSAPLGNLLGQVLFGWLADKYGRKKIYGAELMIMLTATFGQALAGSGPGVNIYGVLIAWRFVMGVGIGGDYPMSAVITSEFAATRFRGRMMMAVFMMQGFGSLTASIVALVVTQAYKSALLNDPDHSTADFLWRFIIGIGVVPGIFALWSRFTIPDSPRYTLDVERNLEQATANAQFIQNGKFDRIEDRAISRVDVPIASRHDFRKYFSNRRNLKILLGCAWSWFALDFAFYGLGLNPGIIFHAIGYGQSKSEDPMRRVYETYYNMSVGNIILSVAGLLPGYWFSYFFIDWWGRKPIQLMGFSVLTVIFIIMGFGYNAITSANAGAFAFLYALAQFFQNFGPNSTTFIIPGELFPTRYRALSHGIAAASGKLGAVIAQIVFFYARNIGGPNKSVNHILEILALFMLTGVFSTLILPETKGKTLETLAGEEETEDVYNSPQDTRKTMGERLSSMTSIFKRSKPTSPAFSEYP